MTGFYFIDKISWKNAYKFLILVTPLPILVTPLPKSFGNVSARPPNFWLRKNTIFYLRGGESAKDLIGHFICWNIRKWSRIIFNLLFFGIKRRIVYQKSEYRNHGEMRILKIFILLFSLTSGIENKEEEIGKRGPLEFLMNLNCQMMPGYLKRAIFRRFEKKK